MLNCKYYSDSDTKDLCLWNCLNFIGGVCGTFRKVANGITKAALSSSFFL